MLLYEAWLFFYAMEILDNTIKRDQPIPFYYKMENWYFITGLNFILIPLIFATNTTLDFQLHDTYIVISLEHIGILIGVYFIICGIFHLVSRVNANRITSFWISSFHLLSSFFIIKYLFYLIESGNMMGVPRVYRQLPDGMTYEDYAQWEMTELAIIAIGFILLQFILIFAFYRTKKETDFIAHLSHKKAWSFGLLALSVILFDIIFKFFKVLFIQGSLREPILIFYILSAFIYFAGLAYHMFSAPAKNINVHFKLLLGLLFLCIVLFIMQEAILPIRFISILLLISSFLLLFSFLLVPINIFLGWYQKR